MYKFTIWELVKGGHWNSVCDLLGIDKRIRTPLDKNTSVLLTDEEAMKLGLVKTDKDELIMMGVIYNG